MSATTSWGGEERAVGLRRRSFPPAANCTESVTGSWSRLLAKDLPLCELRATLGFKLRDPSSSSASRWFAQTFSSRAFNSELFQIFSPKMNPPSYPRDISLRIDSDDVTTMLFVKWSSACFCQNCRFHMYFNCSQIKSTSSAFLSHSIPCDLTNSLMKWSVTKILTPCNQSKVWDIFASDDISMQTAN